MNLPRRVDVYEVGPRDGFQMEAEWIPTPQKVRVINALSQTGLRLIQVTAFVHPSAVPQHKHAEDVYRGITRVPGIIYEALVLNRKGAERALAAGADKLEMVVSATDSHSLANANRTTAEALDGLRSVARLAADAGIPCSGGIATALGCPYEGFPSLERLAMVCDAYRDMGVSELSIADTSGMANPSLVYDRLTQLRGRYPEAAFRLHLHDTRRMATANIIAALEAGVTRFDGAVGGLGGCPYAPGATGNIATEDMVHMFHEMGLETGVDLDRLIDVARVVGEIVRHPLESSMVRAGKSQSILGRRVTGQVKAHDSASFHTA